MAKPTLFSFSCGMLLIWIIQRLLSLRSHSPVGATQLLYVRVKRAAIILLLVVAVVGLIAYFLLGSRPPSEATLLQDFRAHRSSFEQLRAMLRADTQVRRLADWGVQTDKGIFKPPAGNMPLERFHRYLDLLKDVGGKGIARDDGVHANPTILIWGAGFGGDAVHVAICSRNEAPSRQVASLDQYYRDHKAPAGKGWIYQHIEGEWYLATDLWSQ